MFVVDLDRGVPVCRVVPRKGVFGDDATRAGSTRVVLRRRLGFVRGAGGLRNRFTGARGTDAAPNISSVAARRAEAVDGSMMGCPCYSTASVVGRDTGRVDWISSMRRFIHRATAVGSGEELDPRWLDVSARECLFRRQRRRHAHDSLRRAPSRPLATSTSEWTF